MVVLGIGGREKRGGGSEAKSEAKIFARLSAGQGSW